MNRKEYMREYQKQWQKEFKERYGMSYRDALALKKAFMILTGKEISVEDAVSKAKEMWQ